MLSLPERTFYRPIEIRPKIQKCIQCRDCSECHDSSDEDSYSDYGDDSEEYSDEVRNEASEMAIIIARPEHFPVINSLSSLINEWLFYWVKNSIYEKPNKMANPWKFTGNLRTNGFPLACPFFVKDGTKYWNCQLENLRSIYDVISHCLKRHIDPPRCGVCWHAFKTAIERDMHTRSNVCKPRNVEVDGLSEQQQRRILKPRDKLTEVEWWTKIYRIAFPYDESADAPAYLMHGIGFEVSRLFDGWTALAIEIEEKFDKQAPPSDKVRAVLDSIFESRVLALYKKDLEAFNKIRTDIRPSLSYRTFSDATLIKSQCIGSLETLVNYILDRDSTHEGRAARNENPTGMQCADVNIVDLDGLHHFQPWFNRDSDEGQACVSLIDPLISVQSNMKEVPRNLSEQCAELKGGPQSQIHNKTTKITNEFKEDEWFVIEPQLPVVQFMETTSSCDEPGLSDGEWSSVV